MADQSFDDNSLAASRADRTIIDYQNWDGGIRRVIEELRRPASPLEFLCLSVGTSPGSFPSLIEADRWVEEYRDAEAAWVQESGDFAGCTPIGILVAVDAPPADLTAWRKDSEMRERLAKHGALLLDRPVSPAPSVVDDQLFLEILNANAVIIRHGIDVRALTPPHLPDVALTRQLPPYHVH